MLRQDFLISVFLRAFWQGSLTLLQFRGIPGCQLHISIGFPKFLHALACLVPPPLVNLGLCHAGSLWNFDDLLSGPEQIAASKLVLEASQLFLCLSFAFVAATLPLGPDYGVFCILWDLCNPNLLLSVWGVCVCERAYCWGQSRLINCALLRRLARDAFRLLMNHWLLGHHRQGPRGHRAALLLCSRSPAHFLSLLGRATAPNCALGRWFALARRRLEALLIFSLNIRHCGGGWWGSTRVFSHVCRFELRGFWCSVISFPCLPLSYTDEGLETTDEAPRGAIFEYTGLGSLGPRSCRAMEHLEEGRRLVSGLESRPEALLYRRRLSYLSLISILELLKILLFWRLRRWKVGGQGLGCQLKGLSMLLQL